MSDSGIGNGIRILPDAESAATPLVIRDMSESNLLMVVEPDGSVEFPTGEPTEAARVFCEHFREMWRSALPEPELRLADALAVVRADRDRLAAALSQLVATPFTHVAGFPHRDDECAWCIARAALESLDA